MEIHDLNTGTPAATDVLAMDTGSDSYKTTPGNVVPDYTSGDSSTATSWTSVTAVASGLSFSTLIGRITTMMKNVRYLYGLLGTTDISGIGGGTVTGAISTLNSNMNASVLAIGGESVLSGGNLRLTYDKSTNAVRIYLSFTATSNILASDVMFKVNQTYAPSSTTNGCLICFNSSNAISAGAYLQIDTSGNVRQTAGNTIRSGFGCFEYVL